jgi:hypothetical protein
VVGSFHGTEYEITISITEDVLNVALVGTEKGTKWFKSFSKDEIENLTSRAKNAKKFNVFCKMVLGSLDNTSTSTLLDILSPYDMELLKSRKLGEKSVSN